MSEARSLSEMFQVRPRFQRSVNIQADYGISGTLSGYLVTPLCREVLRRLCGGLQPGQRERAWSITGPYGAGKSACALFASRVLGHPHDPQAQEMVRAADPVLHEELRSRIPAYGQGALLIVPIVGSREPLGLALVRGLRRVLSPLLLFARPELREPANALAVLCQELEKGEVPHADVVLAGIERVAAALRTGAQPLGLLIILDELGKLLEYAALNPAQSDIYLLQSLAEAAAHSDKHPLGLVVILHQAFERYAARLGPQQQREWGKVQGRFHDIPFLASTEELLHLVGSAIEPTAPPDGLAQIIAAEAARAQALDLAGRGTSARTLVQVLGRCAPLHPTVSLVLGRLFRSHLAQNERSLFAFLSSGEPRGLQWYLQHTTWAGGGEGPFYRLPQLYDYVLATMGSVLYAQAQGKRWAEIEEALDRLPPDCSVLHAQLVKTIGVLGLLGDQRRLKASADALAYALVDGGVNATQVREALAQLQGWGVVVYRRYKDAYSLWEGSDVDLEERFRQAAARLDRSASLPRQLEERGALQPYVAKRHLHETGTLRYFAPCVIDLKDMTEVLERPLGLADGAIVFVLGSEDMTPEETAEEVRQATERLQGPRREMLFFAVPKKTTGLREALEEVRAWEWVAANTPELEDDRAARRELTGRQIDAVERLNRLCADCFGRAASYGTALWVWAGERRTFASSVEFAAALSQACDHVYHAAPAILNELVNRRSLSSSAAAARRTLIERMLADGEKERLGIKGYPPELSMYLSVLARSGLHHREGDRWVFGPSAEGDPCRVGPLWQAIDAFLGTTEGQARSVAELFALLREPPYGLRDGLLPIFLAAAMLCWQQEVALFEDGSFVPEPGIAEYERLMKGPEHFAVQRYPLGRARSWLLERYAGLGRRAAAAGGDPSLISAVLPLLRTVRQLPEYTRYSTNTTTLSPAARAVREAALTAREPQQLLFETLPNSLGMRPISSDGDELEAERFFVALRKALLELQQAYDTLLNRIEARLLAAVGLPGEPGAARAEMAQRAALVQERIAEPRLKAFLLRLADRGPARKEWLESVAALLARKPPKLWADADVDHFEVELSGIAGQLRRVEEIVQGERAAEQASDNGRTLRLGVTAGNGEEWRELVRVRPEEEGPVHDALAALDEALRQLGVSERVRLAAVAELARRTLSKR